jgi:hypothetical protein
MFFSQPAAEALPVDRSAAGLAAFSAAKRMMNPGEGPLLRQEASRLMKVM